MKNIPVRSTTSSKSIGDGAGSSNGKDETQHVGGNDTRCTGDNVVQSIVGNGNGVVECVVVLRSVGGGAVTGGDDAVVELVRTEGTRSIDEPEGRGSEELGKLFAVRQKKKHTHQVRKIMGM